MDRTGTLILLQVPRGAYVGRMANRTRIYHKFERERPQETLQQEWDQRREAGLSTPASGGRELSGGQRMRRGSWEQHALPDSGLTEGHLPNT